MIGLSRVILLIVSLIPLVAQITVTPPTPPTPPTPGGPGTPGKIVAIAGTLTCTINGNVSPATGVTITCTAGSTIIPVFTIPVYNLSAFSFSENIIKTGTPPTSDAITCNFTGTNAMGVKFDCVATPAGGAEQKANGIL